MLYYMYAYKFVSCSPVYFYSLRGAVALQTIMWTYENKEGKFYLFFFSQKIDKTYKKNSRRPFSL